MEDINKEMTEIVYKFVDDPEVKLTEAQAMLFFRYAELAGQHVDCVYEMQDAYERMNVEV